MRTYILVQEAVAFFWPLSATVSLTSANTANAMAAGSAAALWAYFRKTYQKIPLRQLKVAILELPLPLPLLQTAIMEIHAILKAQTDAATSSNL